MLSSEILDKDTRTLSQYLEDIRELEIKGLYPEYSKKRKFIILYWEKLLEKGLVKSDDKMYQIVEKISTKII
jgi:hypothetical protein